MGGAKEQLERLREVTTSMFCLSSKFLITEQAQQNYEHIIFAIYLQSLECVYIQINIYIMDIM